MRKDPEVTEVYKKNQQEEEFLHQLNTFLQPFEEASYQEVGEPFPILHVIGVPRSGTTLLLQLLASHTDIGCINNLIAAFWKAPTVGIHLSKKLFSSGVRSSFQSDFGRTHAIHDVHEFGYFWSDLLGYPELAYQGEDFERSINWERVRRVLTNMTEVYGGPIAFKSFWMAWHMPKMREMLPKTCFVFVRRNPVENALSLLYLRRKFLGSVERWASMKPTEYHLLKDRPYWEQVAGQVFYIEQLIARGIQQIAGHNVTEIHYEELCQNPRSQLEKVVQLLNCNEANVSFISAPPDSFRYHVREPESDKEEDLVKEAVENLYGCHM